MPLYLRRQRSVQHSANLLQALLSSVISEFVRLVPVTLWLRSEYFGFRKLSSKQTARVSLCILYVAGAFQQVLQSRFLFPALGGMKIFKRLNGS